MSNRFGFDLTSDQMRWAAAECGSEDVIAAVLLLHERSVDEIVKEFLTFQPAFSQCGERYSASHRIELSAFADANAKLSQKKLSLGGVLVFYE